MRTSIRTAIVLALILAGHASADLASLKYYTFEGTIQYEGIDDGAGTSTWGRRRAAVLSGTSGIGFNHCC